MYKCIIFDFDGTIADSEKVVNEIFDQLAIKYNFNKLSPRDIKHKSTLSLIDKVRLFFFIYKVDSEFKNKYTEKISIIKPFDKILESITVIYNKGYNIAIISSNSNTNIQTFLKLNNINYKIIILTTNGLFGKHKTIKQFLNNYHYKTNDVLFVGDEIRDIKACKKVGINIGFVKWGLDGSEDISMFYPKYIIPSPEILEYIVLNQ